MYIFSLAILVADISNRLCTKDKNGHLPNQDNKRILVNYIMCPSTQQYQRAFYAFTIPTLYVSKERMYNLCSLDTGKCVSIVLLDLSAAFNTTDHTVFCPAWEKTSVCDWECSRPDAILPTVTIHINKWDSI